jgi:AraC-like DNA-binding protein
MGAIPLHTFRFDGAIRIPLFASRIEALPAEALEPRPNRHSFFELFWVASGSGAHLIDFVRHPIEAGSVFLVAPGQVHAWEIEQGVSGVAILFTEDLLGVGPDGDLALFASASRPSALRISGDPGQRVAWLCERILEEYRVESEQQVAALRALARLLLIEIERRAVQEAGAAAESERSRLVQRFVSLVDVHHARWHRVGPYAAELGMTTAYLSEVVASTLGVPAGVVVRRRVALEAKRLLAHAEDQVDAIGRALGFDDPSYFSRFFSREVGVSPTVFRAGFRR